MQTITELLSEANRKGSLADSALRVQLPVGAGGEPLPVLLLPVPVPGYSGSRTQQVQTESESRFGQNDYRENQDYRIRGREERPRPEPSRDPAPDSRYPFPDVQFQPSSPAPFQPAYDTSYSSYDNSPPHMSSGVSTQHLIELFRAQQPRDPSLPPVLLPDSPPPGEPAVLPPVRYRRATGSGTPPPLRFSRSVMLRGELTVNRADYSEPYVAWYDAATGSSRVDVHGGTASIYRSVGADGSVQRVLSRVDRTDDSAQEVRRCMVMQAAGSAADRAAPALPDLDKFSFAGYVDEADRQAERWTYSQRGAPGELGAAPGEALHFRHEVLATRAPDGSAVPLKYTVAVDSSTLGPSSDTYEHRYLETRDVQPDPSYLAINVDSECGSVEKTDRIELVDSLREFTMLQRDPRYLTDFKNYVQKFSRKYLDSAEEALRKNLLMQNIRFIESANRQGGPAQLAVSWLSDRLEAELDTLLGISQAAAAALDAERFPYSRGEARRLDDALPAAFDWRERGAVTHVRYQGNCPACWAFSVVAAVEGALFVRTRRLVALSDKCLLDCGHRPGRPCSPTWLDAPYAHLHSRGIVALSDYPPYKPQVEQCREDQAEPVTFISAYVNVTSNSIPALKVAIRRHGPTVVLVDGKCKSFQYYSRGVLLDYRCIRELKKLNHAVTAVGWGKRLATHFILKNSWAASYGEGGYVRVHAASNTCGVLASPTYPRVEPADVHRLPEGRAAPLPDEQAGGAKL
ncbi:counting factor associated protein D [Amyelois transitella]|uniref:counting factor associated protein D n=1 Tax=Amyelois transitella TaxID=680683 RepID=UPI00298FFD27|nr:counting factor associated protein D [Amyelois transitella]